MIPCVLTLLHMFKLVWILREDRGAERKEMVEESIGERRGKGRRGAERRGDG